jgi:hypothetical protein
MGRLTLGEAVQTTNGRVLALENEEKTRLRAEKYIHVQAPTATMNKNTGIQSAITNGTLVSSPRVWITSTPGRPVERQALGESPTNAGCPKAHWQVLTPVLATQARKRMECCILAGQQQPASPSMAGGRLLRRTGGWSPPPEVGRPARGAEHRLSLAPAPARMMKTSWGRGQDHSSACSSPSRGWWSPSWVTPREGEQPGWLMKILEAERWLKGTNSHRVAFLQRRGGKTADIPHPGAWKVERHDA